MKEKKEEKKDSKTVQTPAAITDGEVQACLDHLAAIATVLAPYAVTLTKVQRKSVTRFRKGGDKVIPLMARLAANAGVAGTGLDVDAMQTQVQLAKAMLPLLTTVKTLGDTINDTLITANGKAWGSATTLHGVLKRLAKNDPSMRRDMEVVSAVFTYRKPDAAKSATEAPAEAATTESSGAPKTA